MFESIMIKAAQLIAALAFLVVIHEFGHYIIARAFGIKVEKFYLFFNPWFSLVKWKPKKKVPKYDKHGNEKATWRDTEYGIGWLPLGGYVKIAGMIDESMDKEQMAQPEQPWEFRAKPAYQRLCVMVAGVVFNFILAVLIYAGIAWHWGNKYVPLDQAYEGMQFSQVALDAGFSNGDIIYKADGKQLESSESDWLYRLADAKKVTVLRKSEPDSKLLGSVMQSVARDTVTFELPEKFIFALNKDKDEMFFTYRLPVYVQGVVGGSPAAEAGLKEGDRIVGIGGVATPSYFELQNELAKYASKPTTVTLYRDGKVMTVNTTVGDGGKLGFNLMTLDKVYPVVFEKYGMFQSVPKGIEIGTNTLSSYVSSMGHVFSKEGAESIGGFGALGSLFPDKWNWLSFWEITAFLSVVLAFMNIIPIPGLDGGHVLFLLIEVITGRKVPDKVMEYAQIAGMCFLLLLLVYANGNDLIRAFLK
ncbi:MAG: RIP metalloprotease RseP [Bacteroides sp.]|nr:RIP metalloprotease RseP [Bacteroides sp.]MCM1414178.1 RIP metalloprotease RseP [Bacteroides sp.]MCM1471272.1 RIP metalloprotease RseP [Bacteroides sp.]